MDDGEERPAGPTGLIEAHSLQAGRFKAAYAADSSPGPSTGAGWGKVSKACLDALGELPRDANLGFLYVTDLLADDLGSILTLFRERSGIEHWVGTVGFGVVASGAEYYDCPAISCLVAAIPEDKFRLFEPITGSLDDFRSKHADWVGRYHPILGVVHGDSREQSIMEIIEDVSEATSAFLVGGLASSRSSSPQIAGRIGDGGLSGVLFASDQLAVAGLTQGCSPVGPMRRVSDGEGSIIKTIDDRPALDILKEDIGELLARDLHRIGGYIYVAFPIAASDTGDYLVRNLIVIDPERGWIQVGDSVTPGMALNFCRRDSDSAMKDLERMLKDIGRRAGDVPRAGLYYSCIARGRHLFGPGSEEMQAIRKHLGDIPLTGFFANGEISNNRLYAYTGVLTLLF